VAAAERLAADHQAEVVVDCQAGLMVDHHAEKLEADIRLGW